MNAKQLGLSVVLLDFSGLTAYALYQYGVVGVVELETANAVTVAAFADLVIALSLVVLWMRQDARERGASVAPYVVLTLALGSVGPLLYLIRRESGVSRRPHPVAAAAR
ncbi:MAG: DUF2834 domain-containing protein [Deltaproteobacteria bacterium]|nr:MAG: DUF2834 domain-containing protein [Deltaproteobacteria bacterium]